MAKLKDLLQDAPFTFQFGGKNDAVSDGPTVLYNPKNGRILLDMDGAGGTAATKIGKITVDNIPYSLQDIGEFDFVIGNKKAAVVSGPTVIYNPAKDKLFFDVDGVGPAVAVKIGELDI